MKKIIISIVLVMLLFSNTASALGTEHKSRVEPFALEQYTLTNPNPENPALYVLLTDLRIALTKENYDNFFEEILTYNEFDKLGINLEEYEVKSAETYHPNNFDFSLDNVIRNVTQYSKTQDDFDRFYYRPLNKQQGTSYTIIQGALRGGFNFDYVKKNATYDLGKYLKVPNAKETLNQLYPGTKGNTRFLDFAKGNTELSDSGTYEDSHLYNYSLVIELEKKTDSLEPFIPEGRLLNALNDAQYYWYQNDMVLEQTTHMIYGNIVDAFNNYFENPQWKEFYDSELEIYGGKGAGIVEFTGIQPNDYYQFGDKTVDWKDKNVNIKFAVPYDKELAEKLLAYDYDLQQSIEPYDQEMAGFYYETISMSPTEEKHIIANPHSMIQNGEERHMELFYPGLYSNPLWELVSKWDR